MKIISLNLSVKNMDFEKIANFLDKEKADLVCLQEVSLTEFNLAEKINDAMEVPFKFVGTEKVEDYTTSSGSFYSQGQSVLSNFPIKSSRIGLARSGKDKHDRICQLIEVDFLGKSFKIANVHFANNAENVSQLKEVIDLCPDVIIGDFNMKKSTICKNRDLWGGYKLLADKFEYISFPGSKEFSRIDHCLIRRRFSFGDFRIMKGLSDHNAIIMEIRL